MSNFEQRVKEVVEPQLNEILRLFEDASGVASTHTLDQLYEMAEKMFNLLKDVKSEVNKTERQTVPEEEKKKKRPEDQLDNGNTPREFLEDLWHLLTDDDPRNIKQLLELIERFEPKPGPLTLPDGSVAFPIVDDTTLLEWIVNQPDGGMTDIILTKVLSSVVSKLLDKKTDTVVSSMDRDTKAYLEHVRSKVTDDVLEGLANCCGTMGGKLDDLKRDMKDCCDETHRKLDEANSGIDNVNHKVDLLDPVTNANNVLEILQRLKSLQSSMDELRGLL